MQELPEIHKNPLFTINDGMMVYAIASIHYAQCNSSKTENKYYALVYFNLYELTVGRFPDTIQLFPSNTILWPQASKAS